MMLGHQARWWLVQQSQHCRQQAATLVVVQVADIELALEMMVPQAMKCPRVSRSVKVLWTQAVVMTTMM